LHVRFLKYLGNDITIILFLNRNGTVLQQQLALRPGQALRVYSQDARGSFSRQAARRRTFKETIMAPSEGTAISAGTVPTPHSVLSDLHCWFRN